jgi:hypothetical protein
MAFKSELGSINEIDFVRKIFRLGGILSFILHSLTCKPPDLENLCDPSSESFQRTSILQGLVGDKTPLCGVSSQFALSNPGSTISNPSSTPAPTSWSQEAYIKAPNADTFDQFGSIVSISGDTIVVGANFEDSSQTTITNGNTASGDNSTANAGAAYVFVRSGTNWSQQAYIKAPNAEANDEFGTSVSISGDTIVVGASGEDSNQTTISNGNTASGDNSTANAGAAYVFVRSGSNWSQQAYIKAPNAEAGDQFGLRVSISGDTIVVGAYFEDSNQTTITNGNTASGDNSAANAGAAYVFVRSGTNWSQQAYIKAPNAETGDLFGSNISINGDTIVFGVINEDSNQTTITSTASGDNSTSNAGAAYVFVRSGTNWSLQAYIKAPNADSLDEFGSSVSISGDTIVVGASGEDSNQTTITSTASGDNSTSNAGAAYVFVRLGSTWSQQAYIKAPNAGAGDGFGSSVSISGDTLLVGARSEDSNQTTITNGNTASGDNSTVNAGAAYVFARSGPNWSQQAYIKAPSAEANDEFGFSSAISGDIIVVGARLEDSNQNTITNGSTASSDNSASNAGAAYVFVRK